MDINLLIMLTYVVLAQHRERLVCGIAKTYSALDASQDLSVYDKIHEADYLSYFDDETNESTRSIVPK